MDGKTGNKLRVSRERGHKFAKIVLENYSKYRNTVAENYPAITDTKDNKVSFYGAFTYSSTTGTVSISTSGLTVQINSGKTFPTRFYRYGPSPEDGTPTRLFLQKCEMAGGSSRAGALSVYKEMSTKNKFPT